MPRDDQEPTQFDLIPTPDVGEYVVRLWVPQQTLKQVVRGTTITTGTTLAAFLPGVCKDDLLALGYGTYKLTGPAGSNGAGYLGFDFAKPKTAAQLLVPYKTSTTWQPKDWPPVLRVLYALSGTAKEFTDTGSVGSSSTLTRRQKELVLDRLEKIPGGSYWTKFEVKDYLSATPFTTVAVESMVTSTVQYSFLGMQMALDCLHDDVVIPELLENGKLIDNFGTPNPRELSWGKGQFFPATNHKQWKPHVCKVDLPPDPENGVYRLRTWKCFPPPAPRAVRL